MAKRWKPQVGEMYTVREADNSASGTLLGVIRVTAVIGDPRKYHGKGGPSCKVRGHYLETNGEYTHPDKGCIWNVGKTGLIKAIK